MQAALFDASQIRLDGNQLDCTWIDIHNIANDDIVGHGCVANVSDGTHTVRHSGDGGVLSVLGVPDLPWDMLISLDTILISLNRPPVGFKI